MDPVAFKIGAITIRWYGLMAACGFLACFSVLQRRRKEAGLSMNQVSDVSLVAMITGIIGARIFFVIEFWSQFKDHPFDVFLVYKGGLVFYGGFVLAVASLWVYCRRRKLDAVRVLDLFAVGLAIGHLFGRIGCFLNGCCFGKPCSVPWGVTYPSYMDPGKIYPNTPLHPVQLYEAIGNVFIFLILYRFLGRIKRGYVGAIYLILYGVMRLIDECFRGDHRDFVLGIFTPAQSIGIFLIIPFGIILLVYYYYRPDVPLVPAEETPSGNDQEASNSQKKSSARSSKKKGRKH